MTTTILEGGKPAPIAEIERLNYRYTEVAQFDLERLSPDRRVQVRESGHYAPRDEVQRYAIQMRHSQFPPIIVTADDWIVDGNTRVGAVQSTGNKFFPAIVLEVAWATAPPKEKNELLSLAATLNSLNGRALTRKEARKAVEAMVALNWKNPAIGRSLGMKDAAIAGVRRELDAVAKLKRVGLSSPDDDPKSSVSPASLRALGSQHALNLNDLPFKELAEFSSDAGLASAEIIATAKQMKEAGSDTAAIELIRSLRTEEAERIKQKQLTGQGRPPAARQLRQHLGNVVKFADDVSKLVETNPDSVEQHIAAIEESIRVLQAALEAQRRAA